MSSATDLATVFLIFKVNIDFRIESPIQIGKTKPFELLALKVNMSQVDRDESNKSARAGSTHMSKHDGSEAARSEKPVSVTSPPRSERRSKHASERAISEEKLP